MADEVFLQGLGKNPLLINTSRGEVFETGPVCRARQAGSMSGLVIDCWEDEPGLDLDLLAQVDYATPHIAGYSRDGKANGTTASVRAISRHFGLGIDDWQPTGVEPSPSPRIIVDGSGKTEEQVISEAVLATYRIADDDRALRGHPEHFEQLRGDYPVRREFHAHVVNATNVENRVLQKLAGLGFKV